MVKWIPAAFLRPKKVKDFCPEVCGKRFGNASKRNLFARAIRSETGRESIDNFSRAYILNEAIFISMHKLEELVSACETTDEVTRASEVAAREWEKIRLSLSLCGDIGEFCAEDFILGIISEETIARLRLQDPTKSVSLYSPTYYPMYFVENLLVFEEKFLDKGYRSIQALYVYVELANVAAQRLGLKGTLAMGFASGYANVRTGWIAEKGLAEQRAVFSEIFFSLMPKNYDWDFRWNSVKQSFREIYEKFTAWKHSPSLYAKESRSKAVVKPFIV